MRPTLPKSLLRNFLVLAAAAAATPDVALAYVGPGAGITAIGTVVALLGALLLALLGFVWFPVKRLLNRKSRAAGPTAPSPTEPK